MPGIETDAVLHLSEDVGLTVDEAEFGMEVWRAFPDRLVGFVGHAHSWDEELLRWSYSSDTENEYSIILSDAVFVHRSVHPYTLSSLVHHNVDENPGSVTIFLALCVPEP